MKIFRKLLCTALLAALLLAIAAPALADAHLPKTHTVYLLSRDGSNSWWSYHVGIDESTQATKVKSLKSSKPAYASVVGINRWFSEYDYFEDEGEDETYGDVSVMLRPKKPGTTTISAKIDGVLSKMKLKVLKYVNPVKSLYITPISSANLKTKFAKGSYIVEDTPECTGKKGYLKVAAASGWKVSHVQWENETTGLEYTWRIRDSRTSVKMPIPAMNEEEDYYIDIDFYNATTGASLDVTYVLRAEGDE